ncbi:hypothetical protein D0Z03_000326 [Geotrichum reessii]|nr:hypothetical protein D0Z03_000326 [Galactomyces reessii]
MLRLTHALLRQRTASRALFLSRFYATASAGPVSVDFQASPFNEAALKHRISTHVQSEDAPALDEASVLSALLACITPNTSPHHTLQPSLSGSEYSSLQLSLLDELLSNHRFCQSLTPDVLREFFLNTVNCDQESSTAAATRVIRAYSSVYTADGRRFVPLDLGMIPFRKAVYSAHIDDAFAILNLTAGAPGYVQHVKKLWWRYGRAYAVGTTSTLASVHLLLKSGLVGEWPSTLGVLAMVTAYMANMTVLGGLAFAGRVSGSGEILKWLPGTPTTHWYSHAQEMKMASRIAAVDRALPENQDECSYRVKKILTDSHSMIPIEFEQETLMKEYWARGGEGFEWIEPDQDPAEIIWRRKMEASKAGRIAAAAKYGDKYKHIDELLPQHNMPHASLIEPPTAPELDDGNNNRDRKDGYLPPGAN